MVAKPIAIESEHTEHTDRATVQGPNFDPLTLLKDSRSIVPNAGTAAGEQHVPKIILADSTETLKLSPSGLLEVAKPLGVGFPLDLSDILRRKVEAVIVRKLENKY